VNHDGITVVAMLLLAAFAVDRLASATTFLVFRPTGEEETPTKKDRREWNCKVVYFGVASVMALVILIASDKIRLLEAMGMLKEQVAGSDQWVDRGLTFLVLVGGAERISNLLGSRISSSSGEEQPPLKIEGTVLVDPTSTKTKVANV
jgi:hypothetical protein